MREQPPDQPHIDGVDRQIDQMKAGGAGRQLPVDRVTQLEQRPDAGHRRPPGRQRVHRRLVDDHVPVVKLERPGKRARPDDQ